MMTREKKYGLAWVCVGAVTLPVFIGIPLLAAGVLLLVQGERLKAERWIRVLFWIVPAALALAAAILLAFPIDRVGAEAAIARSILCAVPAGLALLASLAMGALTLARFPSLARKHRIMGLGFGALCVAGACIALVVAFPWPALVLAALTSGIALPVAGLIWLRRRRRAAGASRAKQAVKKETDR